jgi:uncharacterized protein (TIRG00374 family)
LVSSQSLYVGAFALLSFPVLARVSDAILGVRGLPFALGGAAALLLLLAVVSYALLARGRIVSRVHALLTRLPSKWLRARLTPLEARLVHTDGRLSAFFASAWSSPLPLLAFLTGWLLEAADTFLILHLLGVRLSWSTVGALEVSASFLRNIAFMVPAGLGVQDLSYLAFLRALNVTDALNVAAAFLLLKRCKECFWAITGYSVLALELRPQSRPLEQVC